MRVRPTVSDTCSYSVMPRPASHPCFRAESCTRTPGEGLFTVGNCADLLDSWDLLPCSRAYQLRLLRGRLFVHFPGLDHLLSLRSN